MVMELVVLLNLELHLEVVLYHRSPIEAILSQRFRLSLLKSIDGVRMHGQGGGRGAEVGELAHVEVAIDHRLRRLWHFVQAQRLHRSARDSIHIAAMKFIY